MTRSNLLRMKRIVFAFFVCLSANQLNADSGLLVLSLRDAEAKALESSPRLRAARQDILSAGHQVEVSVTSLLPKLSVQGNYTFLSTLPQVSFGGAPAVTFGDHNNYNLGANLSYTLWDTFSSLRNYQALKKLQEARSEDKKAVEVQILYSVRTAYVRLQLALEELRLVKASLALAHSQDRDIRNRFSAGAATKLDTIVSKRQISSFQLQLEQKTADLRLALADLLSLVADDQHYDVATIQLDSLSGTLAQWEKSFSGESITDSQPQLKSMELLRASSELSAESIRSKLFPALQLSASTALLYPNGPQLVNVNQNTISLSLNIPLYVGDPNWHLIDQRRSEARALHYRALQLKRDLLRDFEKTQTLIRDLKTQRTLATQDAADSAEIARLYYSSYAAGKGTLTDVQSANNAALASKLVETRIEAQILNQYLIMMTLLGQEGTNG